MLFGVCRTSAGILIVLRLLRRNRCIRPRRAHASDLIAAIRASDEAAALALLALCPGSAWCRDDDGDHGRGRGPYPVHLAAERGMAQLVSALTAMPGERLALSVSVHICAHEIKFLMLTCSLLGRQVC